MKNHLFFLLVIFSVTIGKSQPISEYISLKDSIQAIVDENNIGAQIAIFSKDKILWQQNFGLADKENNIPVTDTTFFRIGSITKMFTAIAALQLVEEGKLSLDDKVSSLIPEVEFKNKWKETDPIQIKHLLEHTTGFDDIHLAEYAAPAEGWTLKQGIDYHPDNRYARWQPGLFSSYCNAGPPLVAYAIEKIIGMDFEQYVAQHIFKPLGMQQTSFVKTPAIEKIIAKGYGAEGDEMDYWHVSGRPSGSINSNLQEMIPFGQMLLDRGQKDSIQILQPTSITRMETCRTTLAGKAGLKDGYGLHNFTTNYKGINWHGHDGGMMGFLAKLQYNSDLNIGFITLVNSTSDSFRDINDQVNEAVYQQIQSRLITPPSEATFNEEYLGLYRSATSRNQMLSFLDEIFGVIQIGKDEEGYFAGPILSPDKSRGEVRTANTLTVINDRGYQSPLYFGTHDDKVYALQVNRFLNLEKVTPFSAFLPLVLGTLFLLFLLILTFHSVLWLGKKVFRKNPLGQSSLRFFSLFSMAGFGSLIGFWIAGNMGNVLRNLGTPTLPSIGIFVGSLIMGISLLAFCWFAVRTEEGVEKSWFRAFSMLASFVFIITTVYLFKEGIIGLRTWAY